MATQSNRNVTLTLGIETLGEENVDKLKQAVLQLAKEGGDAAPEFQKLADEIDRLGAQGQALQSFQQLSESTQELRTRQAEAAESAKRLEKETDELAGTVRAAKRDEEAATRALDDGRRAKIEAASATRQLSANYDDAGKRTQEYRNEMKRLLGEQQQANVAMVSLSRNLSETATATKKAEKAFGQVQKEFSQASKSAETLGVALRAQETALSAAAAAAKQLGVATDDIAASEAQLLQALNGAAQAARSRAESIREMAEADRLLAVEEQGIQELMRRGEVAMHQEITALREAERVTREYAEAKAKAAADQAAWQREADAIVSAAEATRQLEARTAALVEQQRALQAEAAWDKRRAETAAIEEQTARMRVWEQAFEDIIKQENEAAAAASRLDQAFDSIGVRSIQTVTAEIQRVHTAMQTVAESGQLTGRQLQVAFASGEAQIKSLERELRELNGTLTLSDRAADAFKNSMGQIAAGNLIADALASIIERVKELGRAFIEVISETERTRRALDAIYKSSTTAASQFNVLRNVANEAGVSMRSLSDSFIRFSASAHSAGIPLQTTNELFRNLTLAGASLGLTSDSVSGSLDALGQIASKGVVSLEELRQQLGDRLPGALGLAAKGLGLTEAELVKLVETGNLTAQQFFPAFSSALVQMAGETNTLSGNWARLTNALTTFAQAAGDAGAVEVLTLALKALGVAAATILVPLQGLIELVGLLGRGIGILIGALTSGNWEDAWSTFQQEIVNSGERINGLIGAFDNLVFSQTKATASTGTNSAALGSHAAAMATNTSAVLQNAIAQKQGAVATDASTVSFVKQLVELAKNATAAENAALAADKLAKAKEIEGRASVEAARLSGDASAMMEAQRVAAEGNVLASQRLLEAKQAELKVTEASLAAVEREYEAGKKTDAGLQAQITSLKQKVESQTAEVEKTKESTQALEGQAVAARTADQAFRDNSGNLDLYAKRVESLKMQADALRGALLGQEAALVLLKKEVDAGTVSQTAYDLKLREVEDTKRLLRQATTEAASAENLYRDAVGDTLANLKRKTDAEVAALELSKATLLVSEAKYKAAAQEARANGDSTKAIEMERKAREVRIKIMELEMKIQQLQIAAKEKAIQIELMGIKGTDAEAQAKREKLQIELKILEVQKEMLGLSKVAIEQAKEELKNLGNGTDELNRNTDARLRNAEATKTQARNQEFLNSVNEKANRLTADGFKTNKDGSAAGTFNNAIPVNQAYDLVRKMEQGRLSASDLDAAEEALQQAQDAWEWLGEFQRNGGAVSSEAVSSTRGLLNQVQRAYEQVRAMSRNEERRNETTSSAPATGTTTAPGAPVGTTASTGVGGSSGVRGGGASMKTVDIRINGRSTPVGVSSDADADALVGALRALESEANRA